MLKLLAPNKVLLSLFNLHAKVVQRPRAEAVFYNRKLYRQTVLHVYGCRYIQTNCLIWLPANERHVGVLGTAERSLRAVALSVTAC